MEPDRLNIVMADDDPDDRMLVKDALDETAVPHNLDCVADGEELLDYMQRRGRYAGRLDPRAPQLILLDLNMPRKDGRETLRELKADPKLRQIPVVVLTTSNVVEDVQHTYELGANSFIIKPRDFTTLVNMLRTLLQYWRCTVQLPPHRE
jgi:CheY-like chemotaxis protein